MLECLYADVNELSSQQLESMTFEGSEVTQRRAALINAKRDIEVGLQICGGLISSVSGLLDEKETCPVPVYLLELAGIESEAGAGGREGEVASCGALHPSSPQELGEDKGRVPGRPPRHDRGGARAPSKEEATPRRRPPPPPPRK